MSSLLFEITMKLFAASQISQASWTLVVKFVRNLCLTFFLSFFFIPLTIILGIPSNTLLYVNVSCNLLGKRKLVEVFAILGLEPQGGNGG